MLSSIGRVVTRAIDTLDERTRLAQWIVCAGVGMAWDEYKAWRIGRALHRS